MQRLIHYLMRQKLIVSLLVLLVFLGGFISLTHTNR